MLFTSGNTFNWSVDNFGATYSDAGIGLNSPGHANANTKGANTSMLVGIAEDCYGMVIMFSGANSTGTIRRCLTDVLIDPAAGVGNAGSSWSVVIPDLYANSPSLACGGYWYYFPLYLKAGTAIGSAHQDLVATTQALRVCIKVFGKPTRPELLRVGTKVEAFGVTLASTSGTAITPGTTAMGAYTASLGTTVNDLFWWQGGMGTNDTTLLPGEPTLLDVAAGDGTNKLLCAENIWYMPNASEQVGKAPMGVRMPYREMPAGSFVYMRAAGVAAPQTTPTVVAYGLGG
jgi:hypothetical protein